MNGLDYTAVVLLIVATVLFTMDTAGIKLVFGKETKAMGLAFLAGSMLIGHIHIS